MAWERTGSDPATGEGFDSGSFAFTNDTEITFSWESQVRLETGDHPYGSLDPAAEWVPEGQPFVLNAVPDTHFEFAGWTGDVPPGSERVNPLTMTLNVAAEIRPSFQRKTYQMTVENAFSSSTLTFQNLNENVLGQLSSPRAVDAADVDGDGDLDVLAAGSGGLVWWRNDESPSSLWPKLTIDDRLTDLYDAHLVDIDADGDPDVVGAVRNTDQAVLWENVQAERVWLKHVIGTATDILSVYPCDMDDDGDLDIVVTQNLVGK